jgi:hypothetical protein
MFRKAIVSIVVVSACILTLPAFVLACACCAEPGSYFLTTRKPSTYDIGLLKEMDFGRDAQLYMTEAGFDMIKGLGDIENESDDAFNLVDSFTGNLWKIEIRTKGGKRGVLTLPLPAQMVTFKVDIHDEPADKPNGPSLYKEFRFKGSVSGGTGIFRSSIAKPATYFLVFQGRGNGCDNASDFTHWRLEIDGARAKYAFFGDLDSRPESAAAGMTRQ